MMNMSKNKNKTKIAMALLGTAMCSNIDANAKKQQKKPTYDISIPMALKYSICIPKPKESALVPNVTRQAFQYITLKRLLTGRSSTPISILTAYAKELNQQEMLYLSGCAEAKLRVFCSDYLETSLFLNMDKNMNEIEKFKKRIENSANLRQKIVTSFSDQGIAEVYSHMASMIDVMNKMLIEQNKEVDEYYSRQEKSASNS